ncbi:TonB-dependent hemoglobin/transferrin/lactoferrin family receptor [Roseateles sp. DXS20W]|uniref:TonB-dependent hemoglobin/transferrin/lactoferrin family receptor n=1 Tax=Pelomonas lactea TaxID=3299030 RepID=A0ABW7GLU2_9BURK
MLKTAVALAAACACACLADVSQAQTTPDAATELPELTNTATRADRRVDEVPATVTIVKPDAGARDLRELLRDEAGLAVRAPNPRFSLAGSGTGRAGNEGINIRGLEDNRVLMLVDGIRLPQAFSFGPFGTGRAGLLNLEGGQQLEVLRGPASTQFGSDGLAGALALRTLRASDLLKAGRSFGLRAQTSVYSGDDGVALNLAGAWAAGDWDWLLQGSTRRSHELENQGTVGGDGATRTQPDPLDRERHTLLAKAGYRLNAQQRLEATLEGVRQRDRYEVLSARSATTLDLTADDKSRRGRASLAWTLDDPNADWLQQASVQLYRQDSRVAQYAFEDRVSPSADRSRDNRYDETLTGLSATGQIGWGAQRITVGLDASRNRVAGLRDGTTASAGDTLPSKPFPDTDYRLVGGFVQGEFTHGDWQFVPALRYEHYSLKPSAAGYTGELVKLSDGAVTPRLGVVWKAAPGFTPYAQWAQGFKAPTPSQVNSGFSNPVQRYQTIGNAGLKAERADSVELGVRGAVGDWRWQALAFDNRYDDFISQEVVSAPGAAITTYQFINLSNARIRGVEARLNGQIGRQWRLGLAYARTHGNAEVNGAKRPLDTVEPAKVSASLRQQLSGWHWEATVLRASGKSASRVYAGSPFLPAGYTVLDLAAGWQITPVWSLSARIDNATDRTYWRWADVRGLTSAASGLDAYTATGRQFGLVLQAQL